MVPPAPPNRKNHNELMKTHVISGACALALCAAPASAHFDEEQIWVLDFANDKMFLVDSVTWSVNELPQTVW